MPINLNHTGAGAVTLKSPTSGTPTFTLPSADGTAGLPMVTNGSGVLSLAALGVAGGGTGATTLTSGYLLKGNGTSAVSASVIQDDGANVGVGVTPSSWFTGWKAYELPFGVSLASSDTQMALNTNTYYDGNYIYKTTAAASTMQSSAGKFYWYSAPSGTAGTTATFTQTMQLNENGNLAIGNIAPGVPLDVSASTGAFRLRSSVTTNAVWSLMNNAAGDFYAFRDSSTGSGFTGVAYSCGFYASGAYPMIFINNAAERMRISSAGGLSVGTATDPGSGKIIANNGILPRVNAQTTTTSPWAWNSDTYDQQSFSALANALTINADAGTPTDGQKTVLRFKDNGTTRTLTFTGGASKAFRDISGQLTASGSNWTYATTVSKTVYFGCIYNSADSRWDIVAVSQEP